MLVNAAVRAAVLSPSDVVFMYQATPTVYHEYGATVLAWGGTPTPRSHELNRDIKVFSSVGMVTEFNRYYERFPDRYEEGLCRDIDGRPVKVPWLTDHQHKGVPYWWCCTQQPRFREYLRERVIDTVKAGADGVHIDDHMGTAGGLWLGICFCDRCVEGFRAYLRALPASERQRVGIEAAETYNYREVVRSWLSEEVAGARKVPQHPLWPVWTAYQCRAAAGFMQELRELAASTAGHPVPIGANAGLLWPRHLVDYKSLDLFSAETDHHAPSQRPSDEPLFAYRLAEAVARPYAATASGGDWAYVKEHNCPGLVQTWIAFAYASGQLFMAPHHQWCYTPEKGTHWYEGPAEKFAPIYRFVRSHADLFDGFTSYADVGIVLPHRAFLRNPNRWFAFGEELASRNVSYRLILGGDDIVDHPITPAELDVCRLLLIPDRESLLAADALTVEKSLAGKRAFASASDVLKAVQPVLQLEGPSLVRALPRVKDGGAVIHLVNFDYDAGRDQVRMIKRLKAKLDLKALGVPVDADCSWTDLAGTRRLEIDHGAVDIPDLALWGILSLHGH